MSRPVVDHEMSLSKGRQLAPGVHSSIRMAFEDDSTTTPVALNVLTPFGVRVKMHVHVSAHWRRVLRPLTSHQVFRSHFMCLLVVVSVSCGRTELDLGDVDAVGGTGGAPGAAGSGAPDGGDSDAGVGGEASGCKASSADPELVEPTPIPDDVTADFAEKGRAPLVFVEPNGDGAVVWQGAQSMRARMYRDGAWLASETVAELEPPPFGFKRPAAFDRDGRLLVAYAQSDWSQDKVFICARQRSVDGSWSMPSRIGRTGLNGWQALFQRMPVVAVGLDGAGNAIAAFRALAMSPPGPVGILVNRAPPSGNFGTPLVLDPSDDSEQMELSVREDGDALLAWGGDTRTR